MQCPRCNSRVIKEHLYDMLDEAGILRLGAWRWASYCPQCGNVVADGVMDAASLQSSQPHPLEQHQTTTARFMMF